MASLASGNVAARISAFQNRPFTSLGSDRPPGRTCPRKQRSLGNLIGQLDGANELLEARARLKHVADFKESPKKEENGKPDPESPPAVRRRQTNSSVLEELDDLLDTAIGEHTTRFITTDSRDTTDNSMPDWPLPRSQSFTSKSPSKYARHRTSTAGKRRQSRQRHLRTDSSDTNESNTSTQVHGLSIDSNKAKGSIDADAGHFHPPLSETGREPVVMQVPKQMQDSESPVKQRAALFEKLSRHEAAVVHDIPHIHDARNPTKIRGMWPPKQDGQGMEKTRAEFIPSLEKHHMKFHHGRNEALTMDNPDSQPRNPTPEKPRTTHIPPIPLALPQLVSPRRRSRPDISSSGNSLALAPQTTYNPVNVPVCSISASKERKGKRDTSYRWPLKGETFRKTPRPSAKESSVVARAEPDHHASAKKTHENQHRVYDLLLAAQEATKESTTELDSNQQEDKQSTPPRYPMPGALADTPRGSSAAEKEVASQASATPAGSVTSSTPRGRRLLQDLGMITQSPTGEKDGTYKMEQRFALSRSRSRNGGVRVQVEIRSPNTSPERGGEHTVIVTANVQATHEDHED